MEEVKYISKEQLQAITDQHLKLNKLLTRIGVIETQKHELLHEIAGIHAEEAELKAKLEEEYGAIVINVADGSYTHAEVAQEIAEL